jgi:hypothetical protein
MNRQKNEGGLTMMNQQDNERGLGTADIAAASEQSNGDSQSGRDRARDSEGYDSSMTQVLTRENGTTATGKSGADAGHEAETPLLQEEEAAQFRSRWDEIQRGFVDEPRKAVEQADGLVAEAIQQLAKVFAEERSTLEQQWSRGDEVSTDDLRVGLQRYRSFFQQLLEV